MSTEPGRGWSSVARLVTGAPVADSSGVRGLLRHHLALATAAIVACTLLGAALLGLGNPTWFAVLSLVAAGGIADGCFRCPFRAGVKACWTSSIE